MPAGKDALRSQQRQWGTVHAAFARYLLCVDGNGKPWYQPVHNFAWLEPEFGGWAVHLQGVKTAPFTITSQTPTPDPANY